MEVTIEKLKAACDTAYDKYPNSCSHAVWSVIIGVVNPKEPYRQANELIDYLEANWLTVTLDEAHKLALKGGVAVGGLRGAKNGHVIVVYPGPELLNGGYKYIWKKKTLTMRQTSKYPPCMSTSIGDWPGAKSKGDKTVWDPWANDEIFKKVKFWIPKQA